MKRTGLSFQCSLFFILCFLLAMSLRLPAVSAESDALANYTAPNGIQIVSYHPGWTDEARLRWLWEELMQNTHFGEETYLGSMEIHPGNYNSYYHYTKWQSSDGTWGYQVNPSIVFFPDTVNNEYELARTLAHEYGHHFTMYYLGKAEGTDLEAGWQNSGYAKIRHLSDYPAVSPKNPEHRWQPAEIAAEDYVQLFGSPNARHTFRFDNQDFSSKLLSYNTNMYNLAPQENLALPLAAQVPGLREYWLKLAGQPADGLDLPPTAPVLALTKVIKSPVYSNACYLVIQWSKSLHDAAGPIDYTLVEYRDKHDNLGLPIATLTDGYQAKVPVVLGEEQPIRYYRVFAKDAQGLIVSSELLEVNTDHPQITNPPKETSFIDIPPNHWAVDAVNSLVQDKVITIPPNHRFRPNDQLTRAEFAALLTRALKFPLTSRAVLSFRDTAGHWGSTYIEAIKQAGITQGYPDGTFHPDAPITRAEIAAMLVKTLKLQQNWQRNSFTDANAHWATGFIQAVSSTGLMQGYADGSFHPDQPITRAEAAAVMARLMKKLN